MADPLDPRTLKYAEYIDETVLGTTPTNPAMVAFPGYVNKFRFKSGPELDTFNYLKGATDTDPLSSAKTVKTGETHDWSCEMKATSLGLLPHALLGATKTTYTPGTTLLPISVGVILGTDYTVLKGCPITSWQMEFPDVSTAAVLKVEGMAMDRIDFSATNYIGTGSHSTVPTGAPLNMGDITNFSYDNDTFETAELSVGSLKFGVENDVEPVIDVGSSLPSKVGGWSFMPREINLEVEATLLGTGAIDDAKGGDTHEVEFTVGGKTLTFGNITWSNAPDVEMSAEDLIGFTLKADPVSVTLTIA